MKDEPGISCPICGATNPADAERCEACGVALKDVRSSDQVDALLEDLLELPEQPASEPMPTPPDERSDDVDQEAAEKLFDSLLVEIQPSSSGDRGEGRSRASVAATAEPTVEGFADVTQVPVLATPAETEGRKIVRISGRIFDLVTSGTVVVLVLVFIYFRMYVNPFDPTNPFPTLVFAAVALGGMAAGLVLFRYSNSAVAQGDRLVKAGRYQEAIRHYERSIRVVRRPSYAWTSRGVAMKYLGRLDEALRSHENAIRLDSENEVAWCNLGTVYFKQGELGKALDCYNKAITIRPRYAIAWNNKGVVLARMNRLAEADKCHTKATKLRPEYVAAWLNRGEVLARLGAREQAQACLEKARAISRGASA